MGDIIAAVATSWGEAAIAVIRLSGAGCVALADRFFHARRPLAQAHARTMTLGTIRDGEEVVDQVLAVRFEAGASYTGEEAVEVHCHGGAAAARTCMDLFIGAGARVAQPGEFTKRAFLSGRIDLAQAEAVLGVIRAKSDSALRASGRALLGALSARLRSLMDDLTGLRAALEVRLDYPEEVDDQEAAALAHGLSAISARTEELLDRCRVGLILKNGVAVAIAGRPNVGKSSLLNALLGEERAIVAGMPGTTRDTVDASFVYRGMPIRVVDTAGIRETDDLVENMGIERSIRAVREADLCILVADASDRITDEDRRVAEAVSATPAILVLNKSDLAMAVDAAAIETLGPFSAVLELSALLGSGLDRLKEALFDLAVGQRSVEEGYAATERVVDALTNALACMRQAGVALESGVGIDVTGSLLGEASEFLAAPLGADASEDLLNRIFSTFCVGK